jgi:hypothetical protein
MELGIEFLSHRFDAKEMLLDNLWHIPHRHMSIPNLFWENQHHWATATFPQAANALYHSIRWSLRLEGF